MIKKFTLILISFFSILPLYAQMSDEAVVSYVKEAMAAGRPQQDIVKELAARGVTKAQAERLKDRYASAQSNNETVRKPSQQERTRRMEDPVNGVSDAELEMVTSQVSVENYVGSAQRQAVGKTPVFGRNVFNNRNLTFAPSANIPTPANYTLGPGDEVIIDIWGTNQNTIRQTISPDGFINIADVGLISLNGMTVKEADSFMRRKLSQIYAVDGDDARSEIKLTLGGIRTIQVNVMGEVAVPGTYYLSSLSNVYHALYRAGGFSDLGSLRNIELVRNGRKIEDIDIYEFIIDGKSPDDIILQEGDIILVPTYEMLVDVSGNVKRPMIYEMKDGETVIDIIGFAGGFMGNAYTENLTMVRQNGREYQVYTLGSEEYPSFCLMDGDVITVGAILDRFENRLEIKGAVYRPGIYQLSDRISTVKALVDAADGLKGDAFTNRALIHREKEDYTLEVIPVDIKAVMNGTAADIALKPNDVLYIPSVHDLNDIGYVTVTGEVAKPGTFIFADNMTVEDVIIQAGGLLESASTAKIDVSRRIKNPQGMESSSELGHMFSLEVKDGYVIDGGKPFVLQPYDHIYVRKSPQYGPQQHVRIQGEVIFPGLYALEHKNTTLSDLVNLAGGVSDWAYVKGARLSRRMTPEERTRFQSTISTLENAKDSATLSNMIQQDSYFVGVNLEEAMANPGSEADIFLKEGDVLLIPEYLNTVSISGNVLYPNTVTFNSNMSVKDYIDMAGGYGFKAKRNRAYIVYINGTVARVKKFSRNLVEPGCEIVVPERRIRENQLQNILSVATTSSSIATMIATIGNILK